MNHNLRCEYGRVMLRPLTINYIEKLRQLRNQPQIRKWFYHSQPISEEDQIKWFESYLSDPTDYMYAVFLKTDPERFIGAYANYNLDIKTRTIEAGRLMLDSQNIAERDLGCDIVGAGVKIVFENLPVDVTSAEVFAENERSIRCFMFGGGFKITQRKMKAGQEILCLSVSREEYINRNANFY